MKILTNKHFIAAMIITPILAIIAYFATDYLVSERPHKAVEGNSYPLAAKSNCRYQSGRCTLKNGDIEIDLHPSNIEDGNITIQLNSGLPLEGAKIALSSAAANQTPQSMQSINSEFTQWQATLENPGLDDARFLIVIAVDETVYYGETGTVFTSYQTIFPQSNLQ